MEKKDLAKKAVKLNEEIHQQKLSVLSKLFITSCAAQIAVEGLDELVAVKVFKSGTKVKMNNFQNFLMREMKEVVNLTYELDEEMTQHLTKALENYIKKGVEGIANEEPASIISKFYDDKS